jgi:molybdate transport system regulatory protein
VAATSEDDAAPLRAVLQLAKGEAARVGEARVRLLEAIAEKGSISAAAKVVGLSYKGAWDAVQALNNLSDRPLVAAQPGGAAGGAATVTPAGTLLISAFRRIEAELSGLALRLGHDLAGDAGSLAWSLGMKTSARNALRGIVVKVTQGGVNSEVELEVSPKVRIVSIITRESVQDLGLEPGRPVLALIKSSFVILAEGGVALRTSARNCIPGKVVRHERGAVNDEVVLEVDGGKTLTATITRESADVLGVAPGVELQALIKASHVILAVE